MATEKEIFFAALEKATPAERTAYIEAACGRNAALRRRVQLLLDHHFHEDGFMQQAAVDHVPTVETAPLEAEDSGAVIGHYKLLEKIGEGGFGAVYVAEQREPVKRRVALKIIKLGMDTRQVVARFEAERQALALMDHPNIAKVHDGGVTENGRPYFVMELVKGVPLTGYCDQEKLGTRKRLELFIQVCHAIQHAHQKGIIHRDIKPSNILVTLHDGVPVPKVIDFGIAKATQQELTEKTIYTQFQQFIGTPAYMSPEQADMSGVDIDTRSDIYSLGVLLYELLTGSTPFDTKELLKSGLDEMRKIVRERQPVRPSTRLLQQLRLRAPSEIRHPPPAIEKDLDSIVMRCLEKDRRRRYETANGLAEDIDRHLHHQPVAARPPSAAYRLEKFVRRNKIMVTAALLAAGALILGATLAAWQAFLVTAASRRATEAQRIATEAARLAHRNLYAADMNLAQQALQANNLGRVKQLLEAHRPAAGETDLRGWEWCYLWSRSQSDELSTLCRYPQALTALAWSTDSQWLAVNRWNGTANLWNMKTKRSEVDLDAVFPHGKIAFSPTEQLLAYGSYSPAGSELRIWDVAARKEHARIPTSSAVLAIAFTPDGNCLATISRDGSVHVRAAGTWGIITNFVTPTSVWANYGCLAFSPDGRQLAVGQLRDGALLLTWRTGRVERHFTVQSDGVTALAFSPDARYLAVGHGYSSYEVQLYDLIAGTDASLPGHTGWISGLVFSRDSRTLFSSSADSTIRMWDVRRRSQIQKLQGSTHEIWGIALSANGAQLASAGRDGSLRLWDTSTRPRATDAQHLDDVESLAFTPDGGTIARIRRTDGSAVLHEWPNLKEREGLDMLGTNLAGLAFSPDRQHVATSDRSGNVRLWKYSSQIGAPRAIALLHQLGRVRIITNGGSQVVFSPKGTLLLAKGTEEEPRLWRVKDRSEVRVPQSVRMPVPQTVQSSWPCSAAISSNEKLLALGYPDGRVQCWGISETGLQLEREFRNGETFLSVAFSPDSAQLVTASEAGLIGFFDVPAGAQRVVTRAHSSEIVSIAYSTDGRRLVTSSLTGEIKLWDATTARELATLPAAEHGTGLSAAFGSPEGDTIFAVSAERGYFWTVPSLKEIDQAESRHDPP